MSWSKRGPSREERDAASPKLTNVVKMAVNQRTKAEAGDYIEEDIDLEQEKAAGERSERRGLARGARDEEAQGAKRRADKGSQTWK